MSISCRSETGVTIGLVDALISIGRILAKRNWSDPEIQEALKDLRDDEDMAIILDSIHRMDIPKEATWTPVLNRHPVTSLYNIVDTNGKRRYRMGYADGWNACRMSMINSIDKELGDRD